MVTITFFILLFLYKVQSGCSDNCMAYNSQINYITPYTQYNFFYLSYPIATNDVLCRRCYFNVTSKGSFFLGIYNYTSNRFFIAINGESSVSSGFSSCESGYCAIMFNNGFTSFTVQSSQVNFYTGGCIFNNTFCSGNVDTRISSSIISFYKTYDLNCSLSLV